MFIFDYIFLFIVFIFFPYFFIFIFFFLPFCRFSPLILSFFFLSEGLFSYGTIKLTICPATYLSSFPLISLLSIQPSRYLPNYLLTKNIYLAIHLLSCVATFLFKHQPIYLSSYISAKFWPSQLTFCRAIYAFSWLPVYPAVYLPSYLSANQLIYFLFGSKNRL